MYVADLIDDEQGVDEVAAASQTFVRGIRVAVGGQELVAFRHKLGTLCVTENLVAVDPRARLCADGHIVGVGCVLERAQDMKVGEGELFHGH